MTRVTGGTNDLGKIIKQNMVTVHGSKSTYKLNDKRNSSVEIHYGTAGP